MSLIDEKTREELRKRFARTLEGPVELRLHRRPDSGRLLLPHGQGCRTCAAAEELVRTLAEAAPDKVRVSVIDVSEQPVEIEALPSLALSAPGGEARIVFQGLPAGYEFATLVDAVERTSGRGHGLPPKIAAQVAQLEHDLEVMVFVTPTCPYCPGAAATANRMALASPRVRSVIVEANEYPELALRYEVQGVPRTVVNRRGAFVGALPEGQFVDTVLRLAAEEAA